MICRSPSSRSLRGFGPGRLGVLRRGPAELEIELDLVADRADRQPLEQRGEGLELVDVLAIFDPGLATLDLGRDGRRKAWIGALADRLGVAQRRLGGLAQPRSVGRAAGLVAGELGLAASEPFDAGPRELGADLLLTLDVRTQLVDRVGHRSGAGLHLCAGAAEREHGHQAQDQPGIHGMYTPAVIAAPRPMPTTAPTIAATSPGSSPPAVKRCRAATHAAIARS